jgi:hypothetical protein
MQGNSGFVQGNPLIGMHSPRDPFIATPKAASGSPTRRIRSINELDGSDGITAENAQSKLLPSACIFVAKYVSFSNSLE